MDPFAILLTIYNQVFMPNEVYYDILTKLSRVLLIAALGFFLIQAVKFLSLHLQNKLKLEKVDNLEARKRLTQLKMFEANTYCYYCDGIYFYISYVFRCIENYWCEYTCVGRSNRDRSRVGGPKKCRTDSFWYADCNNPTFETWWCSNYRGRMGACRRNYGDIHCRESLMKGASGCADWLLLTNPFQNWTRTTSDILGYVFLYVSYDLPVEPMRKRLLEIVKDNSNWDGRVQNIQVTDTKEWCTRSCVALLSSADSSKTGI